MTAPNPFDNADVWDTLNIGGCGFGGAFEFSGDALKRRLDRRHASGRDGAHIRDRGYDIAELTLTLKLWESGHWSDLEALVALLFPRSADATRRNAHSCAHPALALAGITEVYATGMDVPKQTSPTLWEVTIKLVEYRPEAPRNVSRTPRAQPDIGANRTAFTGTEPAPPAPTPPSTPGPNL